MRRVSVFVVLAVLVSAPGFARGQLEPLDELKHTTPQQRAEVQTEFMKEKLDLTPEQAEKVATLNLEYAKKADPVLKSDDGLFKKVRLLRADRDAKKAALDEVLTPEQSEKLASLRDALRQRMKEKLAKKAEGAATAD